ncbi:MAG: ribosome biogenesis GTP-binding protein YihA/YsxC [Pseudomonadota bacterium]
MTVNEYQRFRAARYGLNAHRVNQLPDDSGGEVAFAGRSNAGKSTVINAMTDQKSLARTSKTPGRTQHMVVFELDGGQRLIDLPGYGYAKVSQKLREHWDQELDRYFRSRRSLRGLILIMDIRHPLKPFDLQFLKWCQRVELPCHVLLNKADKLKRGPANAVLLKVRADLKKHKLRATCQTFSGHTRAGIEQTYEVLEDWLGPPEPLQTSSAVPTGS